MSDEKPPVAEIGQWIKLTGAGWRDDNPDTSWQDGPPHGTVVQVTGYQDADYNDPGTEEPMFKWGPDEDHIDEYAAARDDRSGDWRYEMATDAEVRAHLGATLPARIASLRKELADLERLEATL